MIHNLTSCLPSGPLSSHSQFGLQTTFKPQIKQGLHSSQRKASLKGVARTSAVSHKSSVKINKSAPKQFSQPTLHQFLDSKSPLSSFTDLSEGTLGDLLDLQGQSSLNNFQLESGHSVSTQTGGRTLRKRAQTSITVPGSIFGLGTYQFAPKSLNQKRFLLEDNSDLPELAKPHKKTQVKSDDDALQLHLSIYNDKVISGASLFKSPSKISDHSSESLPQEFSDTCLASLRKSLQFCSQVSQMTRADSNFEITDTENGCSEFGEDFIFRSSPNLDKLAGFGETIYTFTSSEIDDVNLECEELVNLNLKKSSENAQVSQPSSAQDSTFLAAQIKLWENNNHKSNSAEEDFELLQSLQNPDSAYFPNPDYLAQQPNITGQMRATLIDWMIEVCKDFHLKRDTLYIAVNYLDRYFSLVPNVDLKDIQCVGISCVYLASKMEEVQPQKVSEFAKITDGVCTAEQITQMELTICKVLKFKLNPVTLYTLANSYMTFWDKFVNNCLNAASVSDAMESGLNFKHPESYKKFREVVQILDLILLNIETLKYNPSSLVAAIIYLVTGRDSRQFTQEQIINNRCADLKNEGLKEFNNIFEAFLREYQAPSFENLLESIEFICPYFAVPLSCELPMAVPVDSQGEFKGSYQEFLSFQLHSPSNLPFIQERFQWE